MCVWSLFRFRDARPDPGKGSLLSFSFVKCWALACIFTPKKPGMSVQALEVHDNIAASFRTYEFASTPLTGPHHGILGRNVALS